MSQTRLRLGRSVATFLAMTAGFSTIETSVIIGATSILSATAAPHLQEYVDMARQTKARGDVRLIALSMFKLSNDVGRIGGHLRSRPEVLVGEGEAPEAGLADAEPWTARVDDPATQSLAAHLVNNDAGYKMSAGDPYRWRGPYLESVSADPWGTRYAINVTSKGGLTGIVISPGPNRIIETPFHIPTLRPGGDDVLGFVAAIQ